MRKYEMLYILSTEIADEERDAIISKFEKVVLDNGGTVEKIDKWGAKKLVYPINYKTEGYYVLINFTSKTDFPAELERIYKITDGIIRYIVINQDER